MPDLLPPIPAVPDATVIFVINRRWSADASVDDVYEATRAHWKVGADTRERAVHALGVAGGVVRGAYRIDAWEPSPDGSRWGFTGRPASELGVVGTSVERLAPKRGAANPVRLYLDGIPPTSAQLLADTAAELDSEPLARIMYGQRELFHSNLLAWFFDAMPQHADVVFRDLTGPGDASGRGVERERENLDLVMRWDGAAPLVIENKVFSLPERAQLDEYRAKTANWKGSPAVHVLLSMTPPPHDVAGWTYLSYQDLSERIELALVDAPDGYETETMRHYARVIRLLSAMLDTTVVHSSWEFVWLDREQLTTLSSPQTRSALAKLRARRVRQHLDAHGPDGGWTESAISHSQPLVGWRRQLMVDGQAIEAGWQYQEGQLRRCVVLPHLAGRDTDAKAARTEFAERHPELFDLDLLGAREQRPKAGFAHFAPDFVYRYAKAPDLTIAELVDIAERIAIDLARIEG